MKTEWWGFVTVLKKVNGIRLSQLDEQGQFKKDDDCTVETRNSITRRIACFILYNTLHATQLFRLDQKKPPKKTKTNLHFMKFFIFFGARPSLIIFCEN